MHPDVTPAQCSVIADLVDIGPARAAELAFLFGIDIGEISRQLAHLEGRGLV